VKVLIIVNYYGQQCPKCLVHEISGGENLGLRKLTLDYFRAADTLSISSRFLKSIMENQISAQYFTNLGIPWLAGLWNWAPFPALAVKGAASVLQ